MNPPQLGSLKPFDRLIEQKWPALLAATRSKWEGEQIELQAQVCRESTWIGMERCCRVAGVDLSFVKDQSDDKVNDDENANYTQKACASVIILSFPALELLYERYEIVTLTEPYIPGFLAFREAPVLANLINEICSTNPSLSPDVILVDGNGILHPRGSNANIIKTF
jgi:deoxyinosine 3'endonuclease (endonuclease V)